MSLCDAHHWLLHEGGWGVVGNVRGGWVFRDPGGRTVASTPPTGTATGPLQLDPDIEPDAITGGWAGGFDLHNAVESLLSAT